MANLSIKLSFKSNGSALAKLKEQARDLSAVLKKIKTSDELKKGIEVAADKMLELGAAQRKLKKQMGGLSETSREYKQLERQLNKNKKTFSALTEKTRAQQNQLDNLNDELQKARKNNKLLAGSENDLKKALTQTNSELKRRSQIERLKNQSSRIRSKANASAGNLALVGQGASQFAGSVGNLASRAGGVAGSFLNTAKEFETYQTILTTIEGSEAKAKNSMAWVSDFAAKTPYELGEVNEAFVRLKSYGLDPTNGLLATLGDTGAAMGKPMMQAVEAIADAVTGENERLKTFGIKASAQGENFSYAYTDKKGIQRAVEVNKNDRKAIEAALSKIWSEKYGGGMNKLSETFTGIFSNLKDTYSRFQLAIMNTGAFDALKSTLADLLKQANLFLKSEKGKKFIQDLGILAKELALSFINIAKSVGATAMKFAQFFASNAGLVKGLILTIGTLGGLAAAMAPVFSLASGFVSIFGLVKSALPLLAILKMTNIFAGFAKAIGLVKWAWVALNTAFLTSPIGWIIAGITALVGVFALLVKNFQWAADLWDWIKKGIGKIASFFGFGGDEKKEEAPIDKLRKENPTAKNLENSYNQTNSANTPPQPSGEVQKIIEQTKAYNLETNNITNSTTSIQPLPVQAKQAPEPLPTGAGANANIIINITTKSDASAGDIAREVKNAIKDWQAKEQNKRLRSFA